MYIYPTPCRRRRVFSSVLKLVSSKSAFSRINTETQEDAEKSVLCGVHGPPKSWLAIRCPRDHTNTRILHSGSKAGIPETICSVGSWYTIRPVPYTIDHIICALYYLLCAIYYMPSSDPSVSVVFWGPKGRNDQWLRPGPNPFSLDLPSASQQIQGSSNMGLPR